MTTSLAEQLKKLQVPQTTLLQQEKRRASLLFDPREAATLDRDTVHAIGVTGLEELELLDPNFSQFSITIFDKSSTNVERSVLTSAVNIKLNSSISQFLRILSPYFLLRPAHKALEWLIYRFHIHLYNVDELLSCVLPFHESRIFVRVLQLLDVSDPAGRWHWLMPLQKPGISLPKSVLITHCCKDLSFMKFICELVPNYMEAKNVPSSCQTLVGFYTVTLLGALEKSSNVTEEVLGYLLPFLLKGLKCECPDYRAATYMLLSQIAVRATLSSDITEKLLGKMAQYWREDLSKEFVICTLVIFQHQQVSKIPKRLVVLLRRHPELQNRVEEVSEQYQGSRLLDPLLSHLVVVILRRSFQGKAKASSLFLKKILSGINLDAPIVAKTVGLLLKVFLKQQKIGKTVTKTLRLDKRGKPVKKKQQLNNLRKVTLFILGLLERKYPETCDKAVESFLNSCKSHQGTLLQGLLSTSSRLPERRLVKGTTTPLFLALNHPSISHRRAAVMALSSAVNKGKFPVDSVFVREALIDRLKDDHPKVVKAVLKDFKVLLTVCPKEEVLKILLNILNTPHSSKWSSVKKNAILLLSNEMGSISSNDSIVATVLPLLFPISESWLKYAGIIFDSQLATTHPLLKHLSNECKDCLQNLKDNEEDLRTWSQIFLTSLKRASEIMKGCLPLSMVELLASKDGVVTHFILFEFLQQLLPIEEVTEKRLSLARITLTMAKKVMPLTEVTTDSADDMLVALRKEKLPLKCVLSSVHALLESLPIENSSGDYLNIKMDIFDFLSADYEVEQAMSVSELLNTFLEKQFESSEKALSFLSTLWTEHLRQDLPAETSLLQLRSLVAAQKLLSRSYLVKFLLREESLELARLMLALMCEDVGIRSAVLQCMHILVTCGGNSRKPAYHLLSLLVQRSDEILADECQFQQILESFLSPALEDSAGKDSSGPQSVILQDLLTLCLSESIPSQDQYGLLLALRCCQGKKVLTGVLRVCTQLLNQWEPVGLLEPLPLLSLSEAFSKMTPKTASAFSGLQSEAFIVLERALISKAADVQGNCLQGLALRVFSRKFFPAIPCDKVKQRLLDTLLKLYTESHDGDKGCVFFKILRKVCVDSRDLVEQLRTNDSDAAKTTTIKSIRLLRSNAGATAQKDVNMKEVSWPKLTALLEVYLANKEDPMYPELLLGPVFCLLKSILESWSDDTTELEGQEYLLQVVLSCLRRIICSPSSSLIDEEAFHVDLVVQCVRLSRHPQAQKQALLLLNAAANLFPERVLQSVMAVFTFMGSSLLRKEDNFSFQIVVETVDTIVPALLKATARCQEDGDLEGVCAGVTRVFVDAVYDIPSQRRLPVFCRLVSALGTRGSLWLPLVQLIDLSVTKPAPLSHPKDQEKPGSPGPAIHFALSLCGEFSTGIQVNACLRVIQFISTLPKSKETTEKEMNRTENPFSQQLVNLKLYSERQLQHFKYASISFVRSLLSSQEFLAKLVEVKPKHAPKLESGYTNLLECLLRYIQDVANAQQRAALTLTKFWKALLLKLYDLMDKVTSLLPPSQFLRVVEALGGHSIASVRRKALDMLNAKLLNQPQFFDAEEDHLLLISLLRPFVKTSKGGKRSSKSPESEDSEERLLNQQTALFTLELLTRMLAGAHPAPFTKVLRSVCNLLQRISGKNQPQLMSSTLLCLAELCGCLNAHVLPHLSTLMPPVLALLEDHSTLQSNDLLLLSAVTTIHCLVEHLPAFISSYLTPLVMQVCYLSSNHFSKSSEETKEGTEKTMSNLQQKLSAIRSQLATAVPGRVLLPVVVKCYQEMLPDKHSSIGPLMSILNQRISTFEKTEFVTHLPAMQAFFLVALDFRHQQSKNEMYRVDEIEEHIMYASITLILKLSETSFRPLFYQLYEWATRDEEEAKDRIITFYRLTESLAGKLKSLFVLFANHFVKNASQVLNANNIAKSENLPWGMGHRGKEKSCSVLRHLLATLYSCFLHDSQRTLVDSDCFQTLGQPLLDQLENTLGEDGELQTRVSDLLSPCIAQLAVAAADDASWKPFHYQLLLKTRHADAKVRFAALEALQELASKLGDDYVTLLPEAIPFLAELMEDESFEVEQQCQVVVAKMEQVVGEPLMKYF